MNSPKEDRRLVTTLALYESGEMTPKQEIRLFRELINSGLAWSLQGHYGRKADYLIKEGLCPPPEKIKNEE